MIVTDSPRVKYFECFKLSFDDSLFETLKNKKINNFIK